MGVTVRYRKLDLKDLWSDPAETLMFLIFIRKYYIDLQGNWLAK